MNKRLIGFLGLVMGFAALVSPSEASSLEINSGGGTLGFSAGVALAEIELGTPVDLRAGFRLSTRDLSAQLKGNLDFGPAGQIGLTGEFFVLWQGGTRLQFALDGTLGPIALEVNAALWSTAKQSHDPLAAFETVEAFAEEGISASLTGSYRLSRTFILRLEPSFASTGSHVRARLEGRFGEFTFTGGPLIGQARTGMIIAAMGTARFSPEDQPLSLSANALVGTMSSDLGAELALELGGGLEFSFEDEDGNPLGTLSLKAEFENWRPYSLTTRANAALEMNLGPGELLAHLAAGLAPTADVPEQHFAQGSFGFSGSLGYRLRL